MSLDLPPTQKLLMQQQEASLMLMGRCAVQLFTRLSEKRIAVEKEFSKIPAPPKASKDVFQLCRGFERAFAQTLEVCTSQSLQLTHLSSTCFLSLLCTQLSVHKAHISFCLLLLGVTTSMDTRADCWLLSHDPRGLPRRQGPARHCKEAAN